MKPRMTLRTKKANNMESQFEYLVVANVSAVMFPSGNVDVPMLRVNCSAVSTAWGEWYKERPFEGKRAIRFLGYGGMDVADINIEEGWMFGKRPENYKPLPIEIVERWHAIEDREFKQHEHRSVFGPDFKFRPEAHFFDLEIGGKLKFSVSREDQDQSFKLIHYKGDTAPFGDTVEDWISPYIRTPNRPFLSWGLNSNRRFSPIPR